MAMRAIDPELTRAHLGAARALALSLPDELDIERAGLESLCEDFEQELRDEQATEVSPQAVPPGTATIYFDGAPVNGHQIEADFASAALGVIDAMFQDSAGWSPAQAADGTSRPKLFVRDMPQGSFGFELVPGDEGLSVSALEETVDIVRAAASGDDEFAAVELAPKMAGDLGRFFELMRKAKARVRLVTPASESTFDENQLSEAAERVRSDPDRSEQWLVGAIEGVGSLSRKFDFFPEGMPGFTGSISRKLKVDRVREIAREFGGQQCKILVRVTRYRKAGKPHKSYTLLDVQPVETA